MIKMGYKERILEILDGKELTVRDIAVELGITENAVNVYICRLRDKIELIDKKGRYIVYTAKKQQKTTNNELIDKLVLLMIEAKINSEKYGINITESEIDLSIKRLQERGKI